MMFSHEDPILVLDDEQRWKLLENTQHGRLVLTAAGETDVFPINYRAHDGVLLLAAVWFIFSARGQAVVAFPGGLFWDDFR